MRSVEPLSGRVRAEPASGTVPTPRAVIAWERARRRVLAANCVLGAGYGCVEVTHGFWNMGRTDTR